MNNKVFLTLILIGVFGVAQSQTTIGNGRNQLEISGMLSMYYNHRLYKPDQSDFRKNRFRLRDAQLQLEGRVDKDISYEIQVDFARFEGEFDPENPAIRDAYVEKAGRFVNLKAGYQKLPYSLASLTPFAYSPFFQRAEVARGDFFSRRDVGLTLHQDFLKNKLTLAGGIYTGMGELSLRGDNDRSGNPMVLGRVEYSITGKEKHRVLDIHHSVKPKIIIGANARFLNKKTTTGAEYQLKTVDGELLGLGADINVLYKGFSLQGEIHQLQVKSQDSARFFGIENKGKFLAGGYYIQGNYFNKKHKMGLSVRWEELNANNYYRGLNQRVAFAWVKLLDAWHSALKINYTHVVSEEQNAFFPEAVVGALNWTGQIRLGYQYRF